MWSTPPPRRGTSARIELVDCRSTGSCGRSTPRRRRSLALAGDREELDGRALRVEGLEVEDVGLPVVGRSSREDAGESRGRALRPRRSIRCRACPGRPRSEQPVAVSITLIVGPIGKSESSCGSKPSVERRLVSQPPSVPGGSCVPIATKLGDVAAGAAVGAEVVGCGEGASEVSAGSSMGVGSAGALVGSGGGAKQPVSVSAATAARSMRGAAEDRRETGDMGAPGRAVRWTLAARYRPYLRARWKCKAASRRPPM